MRQKLLSEGAKELSYEIREIVKKADQLKKLGVAISWENIGDPIQKHHKLPQWIKDIISDMMKQDDTYSYCPSKGMLETREFLARPKTSDFFRSAIQDIFPCSFTFC